MQLSEHVHCVLHLKLLSEYSNESASNFALSLNVPLWKLFRWSRRPQLWATGDWQLYNDDAHSHDHILYRVFSKTSNHPGDSAPLQPRFGSVWLLAFPKTKITFERKSYKTINEIQGNTMGQLTVMGRTVWGPKVPTLKGTETSLSCVQCFLYLVRSSVNASTFHSTWLDTFWTDLICIFLLFTNNLYSDSSILFYSLF